MHCELIFGKDLFVRRLKRESRFVFVTSASLLDIIRPHPGEEWIIIPQSLPLKSRQSKEWVEDQLLSRGCTRDITLIAVGGGTLLDLVGFVAATYCRGIEYESFPTTLLAMTDAAIGGKTGLDLPQGKNMIGAFHLPKRVYIDFTMVNSLPEREFLSGLAETVKHALIASEPFFCFLEENLEAILQRDETVLQKMIFESCCIKKRIVEIDPWEGDQRRLLNFGHTVGHAVETLALGNLLHGEAVAMGMMRESELSLQMNICSEQTVSRIERLLKRVPYSLSCDFSWQDIHRQMQMDKKRVDQTLYFVALEEIGKPIIKPLDFPCCAQ